MRIITLGEIMMRLTAPLGERLLKAENLDISYGGSEANVAISLANFGQDVSFASVLPDNLLGEAVLQLLRRYGVHTDLIHLAGDRLGLYFLEMGQSNRASQVVYDRAHSGFAQQGSLPWKIEKLFDEQTIFHISGIVPALSDEWIVMTKKILQAAKKAGAKVSFDCNYRAKLWSQEACGRVLKDLLPYVDYCSLGMMDAKFLLEIVAEEEQLSLEECYQRIKQVYPNVETFYSTQREVVSASHNYLQGFFYQNGKLYQSPSYEIRPIVDRVGGGDAFAAGVLHGVIEDWNPQKIIDFAVGASVLKHSVKGDYNQFTEQEVLNFVKQGSGRIDR